jgi:hypothetical protein
MGLPFEVNKRGGKMKRVDGQKYCTADIAQHLSDLIVTDLFILHKKIMRNAFSLHVSVHHDAIASEEVDK